MSCDVSWFDGGAGLVNMYKSITTTPTTPTTEQLHQLVLLTGWKARSYHFHHLTPSSMLGKSAAVATRDIARARFELLGEFCELCSR